MSRDADACRSGSPPAAPPAFVVRHATAEDLVAMAELEAASFAVVWSRAALAASLAETDALGLVATGPLVTSRAGETTSSACPSAADTS